VRFIFLPYLFIYFQKRIQNYSINPGKTIFFNDLASRNSA